jgi:UDP-glucose 4-epimerase
MAGTKTVNRHADRSALVTGGAGFIGAHLVEQLLVGGWSVRVLDDYSTGRDVNLAACCDRIELIRGDVCDEGVVAQAADGVDVIFHFAAVASVPQSLADPPRTNAVNIGGTVAVLEAARRNGVSRVVYAASSSAYGNGPELPKSESMDSQPVSPYALQKVTGEAYCGLYTAEFGLETVVLRFFNVYGPRQDPASEYAAVIPRFIDAALAERPPDIYGDGGQTRDFVFITDVVQANLLAAVATAASGRVINIATGTRTSLNELWAEVCAVVGVELPARHVDPRPGDVRDSFASLESARAFLGYEPAVDLREGLTQTVESLRKDHGPEKGMMR